MDLSGADSKRWRPLLNAVAAAQRPARPEIERAFDPKTTVKVRQRQVRLDEANVAAVVAGYEAGATVYELAGRFGCERRTVSDHLRRANVVMRRTPPSNEIVAEMVRLYESGLSLQRVGERVNADAATVRKYIGLAGVRIRSPHEHTKPMRSPRPDAYGK